MLFPPGPETRLVLGKRGYPPGRRRHRVANSFLKVVTRDWGLRPSRSRARFLRALHLEPPPANAISEQLITGHAALTRHIRTTRAAVIITGAGDKIFCGGADLGSAFSGGDVEHFIRFGNSVMRKIERFPKPVIAAINGHAMGGGMEMAMACHLRLMKETARMGQTESNLGIIPGYGGTQRLPRLIGRTKALEFLLLGTQVPAPDAWTSASSPAREEVAR